MHHDKSIHKKFRMSNGITSGIDGMLKSNDRINRSFFVADDAKKLIDKPAEQRLSSGGPPGSRPGRRALTRR